MRIYITFLCLKEYQNIQSNLHSIQKVHFVSCLGIDLDLGYIYCIQYMHYGLHVELLEYLKKCSPFKLKKRQKHNLTKINTENINIKSDSKTIKVSQ